MFGFKEKAQEETKSVEQITMEKLRKILELLDKGVTYIDISMSEIDDCNRYIKQLSPLQQSKVSMYWDGGVLGMITSLKQFAAIPNMKATMAVSLIPNIRTHVLNTLNALS